MMKFDFTIDFQLDLLKYTVLDKNGYKALELYEDSYFSVTHHAIIAHALKTYYKRKRKVAGKAILLEEVTRLFNSRDYVNNITDNDREEILDTVNKLYKGVVTDGDEILEKTERFANYVELKDCVENVDLLDYNSYEPFARKIQKAISPRIRKIEERGSFLIKDIKQRQLRRKDTSSIIPTPFWQVNKLTNAGGYSKGSIIVVLDRSKKFKTGMLVNVAIGYLRGKKVLVIDLDNGEDEFMTRVEQGLSRKKKAEILSGDFDKQIRQSLVKRKKLKSEMVVKRMPALTTTANDIRSYMDYLYREFGFVPEVLIVDYIGKMGCISGKDSLHERISEAYIDMGNLALEKNIEHVWTAHHVTKDAVKRRESKRYEASDLSGSIDISKHVQAIYGLNRTPEEEDAGIQRLEVVEQRDGVPKGRAVFKIDIATNYMKEFNEEQRKEFDDQFEEAFDSEGEDYKKPHKPIRKPKGDFDAQ